jgi:hypothetical protein
MICECLGVIGCGFRSYSLHVANCWISGVELVCDLGIARLTEPLTGKGDETIYIV